MCRPLLSLLLALCATATCCAQGAPENHRLLFLGNAQLPPMVWSANGIAEGIAVDLTYAAAHQAGLDIRIEAVDWLQAQQDVKDGKADGLIQINPNPERQRVFDFSAPLLTSSFHIFRRSHDLNLQTLGSLAGKRVGVERGGFPAAYLQDYPDISKVIVPSWGRGLQMVQTGEVDAVLVDRWVGEYEMFLHKVSDVAIVEPAVVTLDSRIAIPKGRPELLARINQGLAGIAADGTRQSILDKWQSKELVYLTRESIHSVLLQTAFGVALALLLLAAWLYRGHRRLQRANQNLQIAIAQTTRVMNQAMEAQALANKLSAEQQLILDTPVIGILKAKRRTIQWTNKALDAMLGYEPGELIGQSTRIGFRSDQDFEALGKAAYEALTRGSSYHCEHELVHKDGTTFIADIYGSLIPNSEGEYLWCFSDITERYMQDQKVHQLAFHDALTGLPNRLLFADRLKQALAASERSRRYGALLVLDLDNFKPLNDQHGHAVGDLLLVEVASRLTSAVREIDTVARFGGDEFEVIVSSMGESLEESRQYAGNIAEKIRADIERPFVLRAPGSDPHSPAIEHRCMASIGVTLFQGTATDHDLIFRKADAAMYAAKADGRNCVRFSE